MPRSRSSSAVADAIQEFANRTGTNADDIDELDASWLARLRQGVIVEVHAGRWRATTTLTLADLGIDENTLTEEQLRAYQRTLVLGEKMLQPKEELAALAYVESQGRSITRKLSLRTRLGNFVKADNYPEWLASMERVKADYLQVGQSQFARWTEIQAATSREHAVIAADNYDRLRQNWRGTERQFRDRFGTQSDFVAAAVQRVMDQIPPKDYAERLLRYEWSIGYVPLPTITASNQAEAERIVADARRQAAAADNAARRASVDTSEAAVRNAALLAMQRDIALETASAKRKTLDMIQDLQTALHSAVYDTLVEALSILKEGAVLKDGSPRVPVTRLQSLVDHVRTLKFWDEPLLDANLEEIERLIAQGTRSRTPRDARSIEQKVRETAAASKLVLLNFDEYANLRSSRALGIPDDLHGVEALVRRGRRVSIDGSAPPNGRNHHAVIDQPVEVVATTRRQRRSVAAI